MLQYKVKTVPQTPPVPYSASGLVDHNWVYYDGTGWVYLYNGSAA